MISIIGALLIALEVIPDFGKMKKCELRAQDKGELIRPGSHPIETKELDEMEAAANVKPSVSTLIIPMVCYGRWCNRKLFNYRYDIYYLSGVNRCYGCVVLIQLFVGFTRRRRF